MYLLYKDHKGWKWGDGGSPPTRPIASGNQGMNMHLSEMISEVVEPVADVYKHGFEAISTEDLLANLMMVDKMYEGWSPTKWWDGLTDESGMYEACGVCVGKEEYEYDEENPEFCKCGARETAFYSTVPTESELLSTVPTDEDDQSWGTRRVTTNFLRSKRLEDWRKEHNWKPEVIIDSKDALPEMLQDYSLPVEIIGCDVEALYPSLDLEVVTNTVHNEILESEIKWQDIDYMEGCRYIALNWDRDQCRNSNLRRVLPVRRSNNGTRPGMTATDPLGLEIHDQEQWVFISCGGTN